MTPFILIGNIVNFTKSFKLSPPSPLAQPWRQPPEMVNKLEPYTTEIGSRLKAGESLDSIARDVALKASVTLADVKLFVAASEDLQLFVSVLASVGRKNQ
jgi:hypothetical protein